MITSRTTPGNVISHTHSYVCGASVIWNIVHTRADICYLYLIFSLTILLVVVKIYIYFSAFPREQLQQTKREHYTRDSHTYSTARFGREVVTWHPIQLYFFVIYAVLALALARVFFLHCSLGSAHPLYSLGEGSSKFCLTFLRWAISAVCRFFFFIFSKFIRAKGVSIKVSVSTFKSWRKSSLTTKSAQCCARGEGTSLIWIARGFHCFRFLPSFCFLATPSVFWAFLDWLGSIVAFHRAGRWCKGVSVCPGLYLMKLRLIPNVKTTQQRKGKPAQEICEWPHA